MVRRLKNGICEVKYISQKDQKEKVVSVTLKKWHINSNQENDWVDLRYKTGHIVVWDMIKISWIQIPINRITFLEQLTGIPRT